MTRGSEHKGQEGAAAAAVDWLVRLEAAEAAEADWLAFEAWLQADPENRAAYDRAERVSADLTEAAPELLRSLVTPRPAFQPRRAAPRRGMLSRRLRPAFAAIGAVAAAAAVVVAVRPHSPAPAAVYQTARGETRMLALADGSHVLLNSASRLTVRLERQARYVSLAEGEAAFDVAHDAARPFLVDLGERSVRVVGTEFDILRHDGRLKVTVRRGVVAVQSPDAAEPVLLRAGDQFDHQNGMQVSLLRKVDADAAFAWRRGELVYRDQPLDEVVGDLNRYYAGPLKVEGPAARLRFSGVLRLESEDAVIRRLQAFLPIAAEPGPGGLVLRQKDASR